MVYTRIPDVPATPGRYEVHLPVAREMSGMEVGIDALVHVGAGSGPTLLVLSGLHGNEWLQLEFLRRLDAEIDHGRFRGRVILVAVANAVAFGSLSRNIRDDSDAPDVNRLFPVGPRPQNGLAEQIAAVLAHEVLAHSDALLDFHLGIWGSALGSTIVGNDFHDPEITRRSMDLAFSFGVPLVFETKMQSVFPGPRAAQAYAGEVLRIPSCGSFLGGAGFAPELEDEWTLGNLRGIRNVMVRLGMEDGTEVLPERYLVYQKIQRVNPRNGGYLVPERRRDTFGRHVTKGEPLGRVISPFTFATIEELVAPFDGYLGYWARNYPVRPGDWAFAVIPEDDAGTRWIDAPPR